MAIGFVEMQGQITRAQDYTTIKHNEDNKVVVEQQNFTQQMTKQIERQSSRVNDSEKTEYQNKKFDAKDKGSNEYQGDGGKQRKSPGKKEEDGKVFLKGMRNFEITT